MDKKLNKELKKNLFVVFEGLDGSGKDTQLFLFAKGIKEGDFIFANKYSNIWITREPTKLNKHGKIKFAYTLNNTAIATPRVLIPILENYQQKDGTIIVPEVLRKYIGKDIIS